MSNFKIFIQKAMATSLETTIRDRLAKMVHYHQFNRSNLIKRKKET